MASVQEKVDYKKFVGEFLKAYKKGQTANEVATAMGWKDGEGEPDRAKVSQVRQYVNTKVPPSKMLPNLKRVTNGSGEDWSEIAALVPDKED